jgi:hypothetical protein
MANKSKDKKNQPPTAEGKKQSPRFGRERELEKRSEVQQAQRSHAELNMATDEDVEPAERGGRIENPARSKAGR